MLKTSLRKNILILTVNLILLIGLQNSVFSQISEGGKPYSFLDKSSRKSLIDIPSINIDKQIINNINKGTYPKEQVGKLIPFYKDLFSSGKWTNIPEGKICQLQIYASKAKALNIIFKNLNLPEKAKLFIYNSERTQILGAYTSENNTDKVFSTELIVGEKAIIEYFEPNEIATKTNLQIQEVNYYFGELPNFLFNSALKKNRASGSCNVNVNCPEGEPWKLQKNGVTKILLYDNAGAFWCSGSLINNTLNDYHPYLLTANHCGPSSTSSDYAKWIFYFSNESVDCEGNNYSEGKTLNGSKLLANSNNSETTGSDFKLLEINEGKVIPGEYSPYYNGWDRTGIGSLQGVCIHHPAGDIKKISFYTTALISSNYDQYSGSNPNGKYWRTKWSPSKNGFGVTEGGSSGAPLFNADGNIIGSLTGGNTGCENQTGRDFFGKLSEHWASNGNIKERQLKPFLDPNNSGVTVLYGTEASTNPNFYSNNNTILLNQPIQFFNASTGRGKITEYFWTFQGGQPSQYYDKEGNDPPKITYPSAGSFTVSLKIVYKDEKEEIQEKTLTKEINVLPSITYRGNGNFLLVFGNSIPENLNLRLYSVNGKEATLTYTRESGNSIGFSTGLSANEAISSGVYLLKVTSNRDNFNQKLVVY
ncbi:MAG: T9SS type A sorting domain-containing protein [Bacteroidales bacterium]